MCVWPISCFQVGKIENFINTLRNKLRSFCDWSWFHRTSVIGWQYGIIVWMHAGPRRRALVSHSPSLLFRQVCTCGCHNSWTGYGDTLQETTLPTSRKPPTKAKKCDTYRCCQQQQRTRTKLMCAFCSADELMIRRWLNVWSYDAKNWTVRYMNLTKYSVMKCH